MSKVSKDTFCVMPFVNMSNTNNGDYRVCCDSYGFGPNIQTDNSLVVWNSEYYKKLRTDLINGIQNPNCESCWRVESYNGYSMRKNENATYTEDMINALVNLTSVDGSFSKLPEVIDFKLGNLCNLKCIFCSQLSSSLHETEIKLWKDKQIKIPNVLEYIEVNLISERNQYRLERDNFESIIKNLGPVLASAKKIRLVGGEPLINPFSKVILDSLPTTTTIEIITNLTDNSLFNKLDSFNDILLVCSIDHIDSEKFNYIRYPANYKTCLENFETALTKNYTVKISATLNIFNIFDFEDILLQFEAWAQKSDIEIYLNYVLDPNYFCIKYLEPEQKKIIKERIDVFIHKYKDLKILTGKNSILNYLQGVDSLLSAGTPDFLDVTKERTRVLQLYDTTRNTDTLKLFPYIKEYY